MKAVGLALISIQQLFTRLLDVLELTFWQHFLSFLYKNMWRLLGLLWFLFKNDWQGFWMSGPYIPSISSGYPLPWDLPGPLLTVKRPRMRKGFPYGGPFWGRRLENEVISGEVEMAKRQEGSASREQFPGSPDPRISFHQPPDKPLQPRMLSGWRE